MSRSDPIVAETRRVREALIAEFGGDRKALSEHLRKIGRQHQDRIVAYPPRLAKDVGRAAS
ncbi:MAG TPA: hypothetical protein VNP72_06790 [Longimicrobium sp.]|nr:hypothetical protein [Longimicrobium sp.]